ncbi:MAG: L-lactate dehydrogenase [Tenericutes bacterium]|nr:MAG: L-lactate dehydrogenase [Mycoplasmatota bacterium]
MNKKIVLVGAGLVGTSFAYSAINREIADEIAIIDINQELAKGNKLDLEDAIPTINSDVEIKVGTYEDVKDASVVVITAGRPQREGETRMDMVADNAKIMKSIALSIKEMNYEGITLIAANPVDVMTTVYQHVTGFDKAKVISSSCSLDSNRLKIELSTEFSARPKEIEAYVIGEHGDSSVSVFSNIKISGVKIEKHKAKNILTSETCDRCHFTMFNKAYEIINSKGSTYYGIGSVLAEITASIINDEKKIFAVGKYLEGEYGQEGVYAGIPIVVGANGIESVYPLEISDSEKERFANSISTLKKAVVVALEAIK